MVEVAAVDGIVDVDVDVDVDYADIVVAVVAAIDVAIVGLSNF